MPSSFFLTNRTGFPYSDALSHMNPFSKSSSICLLSSVNSRGDIRYGAMDIGPVPGTNSMVNSISLLGGNSGISSGNHQDTP